MFRIIFILLVSTLPLCVQAQRSFYFATSVNGGYSDVKVSGGSTNTFSHLTTGWDLKIIAANPKVEYGVGLILKLVKGKIVVRSSFTGLLNNSTITSSYFIPHLFINKKFVLKERLNLYAGLQGGAGFIDNGFGDMEFAGLGGAEVGIAYQLTDRLYITFAETGQLIKTAPVRYDWGETPVSTIALAANIGIRLRM